MIDKQTFDIDFRDNSDRTVGMDCYENSCWKLVSQNN